MDIAEVPAPLRERLGPEATGGLLHVLDAAHREWRSEVIASCAERFERRLVEEVAGLRVQIAQTESVLRRDMAEMGADIRREMAEMGADIRREMAEMGADIRREMAVMGADIRQEMGHMGAGIRQEIATARVDTLKWCFLFWMGQVLTIAGIVGVMLRLIR